MKTNLENLPTVPVAVPEVSRVMPECGIRGCTYCLPAPDPSERVSDDVMRARLIAAYAFPSARVVALVFSRD